MNFPLAYHLTWGTYGARLTGSSKPHVVRTMNTPGTPLPLADSNREQFARDRMKQSLVRLTIEQRKLVERSITEFLWAYRWPLRAISSQSDHVHVVVTAPRAGDMLRNALKAAASLELNRTYGKRAWWAAKGSAKYIWDEGYFQRAVNYVTRQRDF